LWRPNFALAPYARPVHNSTMPVKHPKRPRDFSQAAKLVVDLASGEVEERERTPEERGVDPAASAMGKKGGPARAASMTPERRAEIAKKAAAKRWGK
jgi:hypothetical protein